MRSRQGEKVVQIFAGAHINRGTGHGLGGARDLGRCRPFWSPHSIQMSDVLTAGEERLEWLTDDLETLNIHPILKAQIHG